MTDIYSILKRLQIHYHEFRHPAVFTVEEANNICLNIKATHTKNLFLQNKKKTRFFLVICKAEERVDLKKVAKLLDEQRLNFASSDDLYKYLKLTPGSVSPFGVIHDENHRVIIVVDSKLLKGDKIGFHPNINTATIVITVADFVKFINNTGNKVIILNFF